MLALPTGDAATNTTGVPSCEADIPAQAGVQHSDHGVRVGHWVGEDRMHGAVKRQAAGNRCVRTEGCDGYAWPCAGEQLGGLARLREAGDSGDLRIGSRDIGDGSGHGCGRIAGLRLERGGREFSAIPFSLRRNARGCSNGCGGMPADGRFSGEHHGVGVVEDGVGDVADLGARGSRFLNHRLQHMCGDDCRRAHRDCLTRNALLNQGHAFKVHVHAEVSAGEHHGVGRLQDIRRCLDGGACLDLGDDRDRRRAKCRAQGVHVGRLAHEGLRDVVGAQRAGSHEVLAIAVRDGRQREALGGHVDACVRPQHASSNDFTNHLVSCSSHAQLNRAIRQRYPIARLHVAGQPVMICCRAMRVADLRAASQREGCTGRQHHPARR